MLILAAVAINLTIGENGIFNRTQDAKEKYEIASVREELEMVLVDAEMEKVVNPDYDENEFLNDFINYRVNNQAVFTKEGEYDFIEYKNHVFHLDRSVPKLGDYVGNADNLPPYFIGLSISNRTFSSFTLTANAVRMSDSATYKFEKKLYSDSSFTEVQNTTSNVCNFTGLQSQQDYDIKVTILSDGQEYVKEMQIRLGDLAEGEVTISKPTWSEGTASVTVESKRADETLHLEYKVEETTNVAWTDLPENKIITGIKNNSTVYVRLSDGTNNSSEVSKEILDDVAPTITKFEVIEVTSKSIEVEVNAEDNESGLANENTYLFYLNDESEAKEKNTDGIYTYMHLNGLTTYKLKVEVYDNAKNKKEKEIHIATEQPTIDEVLATWNFEKIYVEIPNKKDPNNPILCNVLYNDYRNGIQIISVDSLENPNISKVDSYNNAINILNAKAEEYNYFGNEFVEARSVGCRPVKDKILGYESGTGENEWGNGYILKNTDDNYETDYNQMKKIGIAILKVPYLMASRDRHYYNGSRNYGFGVRALYPNGNFSYERSFIIKSDGSMKTGGICRYGVRPVFILKQGIKVSSGDGTENFPYILSI